MVSTWFSCFEYMNPSVLTDYWDRIGTMGIHFYCWWGWLFKLAQCFKHLKLSKCILYASSVMIKCKIAFLFCLWIAIHLTINFFKCFLVLHSVKQKFLAFQKLTFTSNDPRVSWNLWHCFESNNSSILLCKHFLLIRTLLVVQIKTTIF